MMKLHLLPLPALAIAAVIAAPAQAQEGTSQEVIVVSAQRANQTEVIAGGTLGVLAPRMLWTYRSWCAHSMKA